MFLYRQSNFFNTSTVLIDFEQRWVILLVELEISQKIIPSKFTRVTGYATKRKFFV